MSTTDLSVHVIVWSLIYILVLLFIGVMARRAMRERSLTDHYLAGRSMGLGVLLLTLFATQYSGNSLSGFPGQTYRNGLVYFMSVTFMVGIVSGYLLFAPTLYRRSRERLYLTPSDFLWDRFRSRTLHGLSVAILVFTLCNYLLAQLMAMGHAFSGLTGARVSYATAVVGGATVILVYELLGGMRAVAWTDVVQGLMLGGGLLVVHVLLLEEVGTPAQVLARIQAVAPHKAAAPGLEGCLLWISNFLLLGLGAPLYPQAVQRIYAARRVGELRRALAAMAFLPLFAITAVVYMGAVGIALFPNLGPIESDEITFRVLGHLVAQDPRAAIPAVVVMMAVVAAIMSTADSCLLSLASILTKDIAARVRGLGHRDSEDLIGLSRWLSIGVMAALGVLALRPLTTLWGLLVIKFEVLIQLSPAFVLGTLHPRDHPRAFTAGDVVVGLMAGLVAALTLYALGFRVLHGLHAGTLGVGINYAACWLSRRIRSTRQLPTRGPAG